MKKILSLILLSLATLTSVADDASWKMHPIFDEEVRHMVETPEYVYFTSRNFVETRTHATDLSLFRYDKKGEELMPLSVSNILNDYSIRDVLYNPEKGYLAVLYKNYNIDLLHNNGSVTNIPYYKQSSISYSRDVNSISPDADKDRLYMATQFGYIALNDSKYEISESRIYGEPLKAFCRLGDKYIALRGEALISADVDSPRLSLEDYETVALLESPLSVYPVGDAVAILVAGDDANNQVKKITKSGDDFNIEDLFEGYVYNTDYTSNGLIITTGDKIYQVKSDGAVSSLDRHPNFSNSAAITTNMSEVWNGLKRRGLSSVRKSGDSWSLTRDWMLPNAPAAYASSSFISHPTKGLLINGVSYSYLTHTISNSQPFQLSGLRQGRWTNYAPVYTNPSRSPILNSGTGIAVDPDYSQYVYISSYQNGFMRLNLNDPLDVIHFSRANDPDASNPGFKVLEPNTGRGYTNITEPAFDKQGNLWMAFPDWTKEIDTRPCFYVWQSADRRASTPASIKGVDYVEFDINVENTNYLHAKPLKHSGNGLIVFASGRTEDEVVLIDTNGTPLDTSDDNYYKFTRYTDADGNTIEMGRVNQIWEDPSTGYVWLCHDTGICYIIPSQVRQGIYQVNRIKVPRNDGTNFADYLLDGVSVNHMTSDSEGRKWFATLGAGVTCTSSDGREIIEEFTTQNSPLPSDNIYGVAYNAENNSLFISTSAGYAEYSLPVSSVSSTKEDVRAYPNPVRPEYSGFVTITDIPTGSFVKIVDSAGNLVKELGIVSGFDILWDLSDHRFNRVRSGVYHIMVSPSNESSSYATVGKILVIS